MCLRVVMMTLGSLLVASGAMAQTSSALGPERPATAQSPDAPAPPGDTLEEIHFDVARREGLARDPNRVTGELSPSAAGEPMRNDDVVEMVRAEFGESTIKAAIDANETAFDVTPKALVALKSAGVPETVIEAMLTVEVDRKDGGNADARVAETESADPAEPVSADEIVMLSQAIERLASAPAAAPTPAPAPEPIEPEPAGPAAVTGPQAFVVDAGAKSMLEPSLAQVAFTDSKGTGSTALRTLENLSSRKALVFASPALAVASEIGGLFRSDDPMATAVWALPSATADRSVRPGTRLEIEFGGIPGINPDHYRPALVQLVPTIDNFRLVAAARTKVSDLDRGAPTEPIVEEAVGARIDRLERGRYRIVLYDNLAPGEYALVLRPSALKTKRREPASLGELLGGGGSEMLYTTWDFSIGRAPSQPSN